MMLMAYVMKDMRAASPTHDYNNGILATSVYDDLARLIRRSRFHSRGAHNVSRARDKLRI